MCGMAKEDTDGEYFIEGKSRDATTLRVNLHNYISLYIFRGPIQKQKGLRS